MSFNIIRELVVYLFCVILLKFRQRLKGSIMLLVDKLTMKNMKLAEFASVSNINVSMTDYACRVSDVGTIEDAWSYIKGEASK